ncbi:hypothetical protein KBC75_03660 [Candidatus Shapirobacteria bacterium]|nr:hypothetical protein [Candidatus Shapirobacteria bacterium]
MTNQKQTSIAVFFGGKISQHLVLIRKAAKKLGVRLDLISYNRVCFDTEENSVKIRGNLGKFGDGGEWININDYDVLFFRTTGKHWEEVDLIANELNPSATASPKAPPFDKGGKALSKKPVIVDPIILSGKPSMACKAYQMLALNKAGIEVPKTVYGSLWFLYETMNNLGSSKSSPYFTFPIIIKGSGGDRGTRVFKADNLVELEELVRKLRKSETEEGKRYMLQEFIPNDGDYRVLVLGDKCLGVMKRSSQSESEFRNNYSAGGSVEVADLPENIKQLAIKAAKVCGLAIAGVDVAFRDNDQTKPVIWEVNKGPQFKGFMQATGIDVPSEIVKFLVKLCDNSQ